MSMSSQRCVLNGCGKSAHVPEEIPRDLLYKAECVIVLPSVVKFAPGLGARYGRGAMVCRTGDDFTSPWGTPSMVVLQGGSPGLQLGGQATDFVLVIMNPRGADSILASKVKLVEGVSDTAGPEGSDLCAATDVALRAEYSVNSRSRGSFAGALEGSALRPDNDAKPLLLRRLRETLSCTGKWFRRRPSA